MGTYDDCDLVIQQHKEISRPRSIYPASGGKKIIARYVDNTNIEAEIAWEGSLTEKFIAIMADRGHTTYASLDGLYALKMSHRYLRNSPHFAKTMRDIHAMRKAGAKLDPGLTEWLKLREKETYYYNHPKLGVSKAEFFTDSLTYTYDHDSIHEAVKYYEEPAYKYFSSGEVECSEDKFNALADVVKLSAVLEESYVLAIERSLVPHPGIKTPREAFEVALVKVCSSITSGWFREFAWENYSTLVSMYNKNYYKKFQQGLSNGTVVTL